MGRPGITLKDVARAVSELEAQGENPSVRAVRNHLGQGSSSTISRHLSSLRISAQAEAGEEIQEIPPKLAQAFNAIANTTWQESMRVADEKNRKLREAIHSEAYATTELVEMMQEFTQRADEHVKNLHKLGDDSGPLSD